MSTLYLVATPIGNLKDITLRALEVLKSVDVIACEDTRHSIVLLNHYEIKKPLISYHKHNENVRSDEILNYLKEGKNVAVISDAGSPVISDPGAVIVKKAREEGYSITVVPGASAVVSAVSLAGIDTGFTFIGFLPDKKKLRDELLESIKKSRYPLVFYVSPHDINSDAKDIINVLGDRKALIVKEITKIYEKVDETVLSEIKYENPKGEFVLIVMPEEISEEDFSGLSVREHIIKLMKEENLNKKDAIKAAAKSRGVNKNSVYKEVTDIKE